MGTVPYLEITDPIHGPVDMRHLRHTFHHRTFQRTNHIRQLGAIQAVLPSGDHSRFTHMVGVCHITQRRCEELIRRKRITKQEARNTILAALLHDVGHRPFSHLVESIGGNHDDYGVHLVQNELAKVIKQDRGDVDFVVEIMQRLTPLSELIFATPLGADKIDYLQRDSSRALGTNLNLGEFITTHIRWSREEGLCLIPRALNEISHLLNTYWSLYGKVYERLSCRSIQRYLQELLRQVMPLDPIFDRKFQYGGESELMGAIAYWGEDVARDHPCLERYNRIMDRQQPRKTLVLTPFPDVVPVRDKPTVKAIECSQALIDQSETWSLQETAEREVRIAEILGGPHKTVKHQHVSLAQAPPCKRWSVPEVKVRLHGQVRLLADLKPELKDAARDFERTNRTILFCVLPELRPKLLKDEGRIRAIVEAIEEGFRG